MEPPRCGEAAFSLAHISACWQERTYCLCCTGEPIYYVPEYHVDVSKSYQKSVTKDLSGYKRLDEPYAASARTVIIQVKNVVSIVNSSQNRFKNAKSNSSLRKSSSLTDEIFFTVHSKVSEN